MASLTGQLVAETYKALLKTIDNDILTASEKQITDGFGGGSNVFIDSQGFLRANKYKVTNGLATQFLKADGSLDANTYLTGITSSQIITALGYTPVTNARTLTINGTTYDLSANRSWTIDGTSAVWGNISGTLSNQTDLQNALNAKFNNPAGTISQYIRGDGSLATFPTLPGGLPTGGTSGQILAKIDATDYNTEWIDNYATQTKNEVKLGAALSKGTPVYVSSANGTNMIVSAASNTSEATSSKTLGLLETGGSTNAFVKCVTFGLLAGLDTSTAQAGDPVWLGVNGALIFGLANKPYAPAHLVYIGVVTRVQQNNGEIFVNVQNGFELKEIHDVYISDPANNNGLFYDLADGLWKNKSIASALGYTPQAQLSGTGFVKASGTTISYDNSTYLTTAAAALAYQPLDADLTAIAALAGTSGFLKKSAADTWVLDTNTYLTTASAASTYLTQTTAASTYQRLDKMVSNLLASDTEYPNSNAVLAKLALKADAANPVFTGNMTISGAEPKLYFVDTDQNPDYTVLVDAGYFKIYDQTAGATRFQINSDGNISTGTGKSITAGSFIKDGGTASQFLKADGSIDSSTYVSSSVLADYLLSATAASTYQRLDKMVSNLLASDTEYPNSNAVLAKLALKADAANPVFTGNMTISGAEPKLYLTDTDQNPDYFIGVDAGFFRIYDQTAGATRFVINSSGYATFNNRVTFQSGIDERPQLPGGFIGLDTSDGNFDIWGISRDYYPSHPTAANGWGIRWSGDNNDIEFVGGGTNRAIIDLDNGKITGGSFVKTGGTSSQYLMADGSVSTFAGVTGSGTTNYLPKWASASELSSTSLIYDTGSSVGIGTISISNTAGFQRQLQIEGTYPALTLKNVTGTAGSYSLGAGSSGDFGIWNNTLSQYAIYVPSSNNVIIGTGGDAGYKFDVGGTSIFRGTSIVTSTGGYSAGLVVQNTNTADSNFSVLTLKANTNGYPIVEFKEGNDQKWQVFNDWSNDSLSFYKWVGTAETLLTLRSNGNIGISNTNPYGKFEISSSAQQYQTAPAITFTDTAGDVASNRWMVGNIATTYGAFNIASAPSPTSTTFTPRLTILPDGNVGINTSNPTGQLSGTFGLSIVHSTNASLGLSNGTNSWLNYLAGTTYRIWNNTSSEVMVIHLNGNTTIGNNTTDSGYKLDVSGTGRFASSVTAKTVGDYRQPTLGTATGSGLFITNSSYAGYGLLIGNSYSYGDSWIQVGRVDGTATAYNLLLQQSGGNVGIGTTSTLGKLHIVNASGTGQPVLELQQQNAVSNILQWKGSAGTYLGVIQNDGNVGIGTTTPGNKLTVSNAANGSIASFTNTIDADLSINLTSGVTLLSPSTGILAFGTSSAEKLRLSGNDMIFANSYILKSVGSSGYIAMYANGGGLYWGGSASTNQMYLTSEGSLGINNLNPVNTAWGSGTTTKQLSIDASAYAVINLQGASRKYSMGVGDNNFYMCYDNSQSRHNITVSGAGNVTINGTADAGYRLDVSGTVRVQGATLMGERSVIYATRLASFTTQTSGNLLIQSQAYSGSGFNTIDFGSSTWSVPLARIGVEITGGGTYMRFGTSNNYSTGITNSALILDFSGGATFASYVYATSFFESSDMRLKTLIDGSAQIAGIENLEAKLYEKDGKIELGYFAQDAEKLMPYAVTKNSDGFLNLSYREVHTAKIARLEKEVAELKAQLNIA